MKSYRNNFTTISNETTRGGEISILIKERDAMAIKQVNFSFSVPIEQLLLLVARGNVGMKVDIMGNDPPPMKVVKQLKNGSAPLLLEGPKSAKAKGVGTGNGPRQRGKDANGKPITAYNAIIRALAKASDHEMQLSELRPVVEGLGLSPGSANSQISLMRERGIARRAGEGVYQLTARGLGEAEKLGFVKPHPKVTKPKAKKKPPPPPPAETTATVETTEDEHHG
jgi:hypothetical protein